MTGYWTPPDDGYYHKRYQYHRAAPDPGEFIAAFFQYAVMTERVFSTAEAALRYLMHGENHGELSSYGVLDDQRRVIWGCDDIPFDEEGVAKLITSR